MARRRKRRWRWWLVLLLAGWWAAGLGSAQIATMARPASIPARGSLADRAVRDVAVTIEDGIELRGWLVRASATSNHAVVLAAGIKGNRCSMVSRAEWYLERGWSTLLVDLRGHGTSTPTRIAMGWHEARDLHAWRALLRDRGFTTIAAHGQSLGGAAIVYGDCDWDRVVLEAVYRDIDSALHARLPWIPVPDLLLWPLRICGQWLGEFDADDLQPVDHVRRLHCPTLFIAGEEDRKTGPDAAALLLAACGAGRKRLVTVPGADHVDLFTIEPAVIRTALAEFFPEVGG